MVYRFYMNWSQQYFIKIFIGQMLCNIGLTQQNGSLLTGKMLQLLQLKQLPCYILAHSPHVFKDGHGAKVDIWGVGKLITNSNVAHLPENLCSLGDKMIKGDI